MDQSPCWAKLADLLQSPWSRSYFPSAEDLVQTKVKTKIDTGLHSDLSYIGENME